MRPSSPSEKENPPRLARGRNDPRSRPLWNGHQHLAKEIVSAMVAVLVLWVGIVVAASSRLVLNNWLLFATWCRKERETRVRLALWLAIP